MCGGVVFVVVGDIIVDGRARSLRECPVCYYCVSNFLFFSFLFPFLCDVGRTHVKSNGA